jgi:hypothetical protein
MMILSTYLDSLQKIESNEPDFIDMREVLFLAVPIFRCAIFGSVLLAVPYIFRLFLFFRELLFLACLFLAVLLLAGVVAMQHDMWQQVTRLKHEVYFILSFT